MKRLCTWLMVLVAGTTLALETAAMVRYEDKKPKAIRDVVVSGFLDYAPFGFVDDPDGKVRGRFHSVYEPMIDLFKKENNLKIEYKFNKKDYPTLVQSVRRGEIDILLGAYHETELYKGLELVYPSIVNNPVTVFMLPHRVNEVKFVEDLKKLKGVRLSKEYYSDFVEGQLKQFNLESVDNSYDLFERLFTGKADYIMISQFYGLIEAAKLGLRDKVAIARQMVWKMPLFIGVSKISKHRKMITQKLTRFAEDPANQKMIENNLIKMILEVEKENEGVVPPTFGLEKLPPAVSGKANEGEKAIPKTAPNSLSASEISLPEQLLAPSTAE